ncbi:MULTISPECIES: helix-turn-helix domain-containing protein [Paenibacillus]|jgi:transcriptional regulator with XRE-family HTH domain|uniref:helix-turn-helix domain-containing protein n=1 Tax=Paenibacillus TaxID=44249 RepID=UPI00055B5038|nr:MULTISPECIES: helix-turn-helix transcriptional regulator [Paenibacillus]MCM3259913.1 helix-turn-helix domain-containing protein [Paenibacillus lautus]
MQSIYQRIEHLIESRGMTKKAFCETLGISTGNFGDWKRGKTTPSTNKLIEIAAFFSVSLDWLIIGKGSPTNRVKEARGEYEVDPESLDPALMSGLAEHEKEFIREYIEFSAYRKDKRGDKS